MSVDTTVDTERYIGTIILNRPEKRNALSPSMLDDLQTAFERLPEHDDVRTIIVTGAGETFSAGADIEEFKRRMDDPRAEQAYVEQIHDTYDAVENCPLPVVTKLRGPAVGAGCEIALAADLRVASTDASLVLGEIDIAIVPPFERFSQYLGKALVRELCYTGRPLKATEPAAEQVFNRIVEPESLDDATVGLVETIIDKSPHALATTKRALRHAESTSKSESIVYRQRLEYECFDHPHFTQSITAFEEGRHPEYR